jgi:excisionase family DNA binding protein
MSAGLNLTAPFKPNHADVTLARRAGEALAHLAEHDRTVRVVAEDGLTESVELPAQAVLLLVDMLEHLAAGNGVSIVPIQAELTTQQAADMLNVSRPFLIGLLERGDMPFHKVGTHRRVRYGDLIAYRQREHEARHQVLDDLVRQAQELDLSY